MKYSICDVGCFSMSPDPQLRVFDTRDAAQEAADAENRVRRGVTMDAWEVVPVASASYNPESCCDTDCRFLGLNPSEPCWGNVSGIDYWDGDSEEETRVHVCRGHLPVEDGDGPYLPEPR